MEATRFIRYPTYKALILRRTYKQLQQIFDRCHMYYPLVSAGAYWLATEKRWHFPSGATIEFGHMQHEGDKYNYQGGEYNFVGFDELTQFSLSQYLYLFSRVRKADPSGIVPRIRATTNPGGISHYDIKKRFIDVCPPGHTYIDPATRQSRCFIPATIYDNPSIMDNDPDYLMRLENLPSIERMRLLHGIWDAFEGQVFTELSQAVHGCEDFDIPPEWEKFMVFDWGYSRPWCALWFAVDFDGTLYLYREHYGMVDNDPNKGARETNTEICRKIIDIEKEKVRFRVADPACWGPTKLKGSNTMLGPSFFEDAGRERLHFIKADNDRLRGKQQVHQRFKLEEDVDVATGEVLRTWPRFVAFNSCKRWWEEMQNLHEDPKNLEDVDTNQPDEGYDCTRYACMARPITPKRKVIVPPGSFQAERDRLIRARKYAAKHGMTLEAAYSRVR